MEMQEAQRRYTIIAAVTGALLVIIGAFGAHSIEFSEGREATFETGVAYHAYHTLAILAACAMAPLWSGRAVVWASRLWLTGWMTAVDVREALVKAFDEHCTRQGPSVAPETFENNERVDSCGSSIPLYQGD